MAKAKYGLFYAANEKPAQVIAGDEMELAGDTVKIYVGEEMELVAAIRLTENSHVRKIT
jgi:hypothetical protein